MSLKMTIKDRRNTGVEMTHFNIDRVEIHNTAAQKMIHVRLGGYLNELQFQNGSQPIEEKLIVIPLEEPDGGDEFSSLRAAVNTKVAAFLGDAQKLVLKTEAWKDAVVK